jgi:tetratricopeptide (TPR) repeat protein
LDSAISDYRIKILKNDWPFVEKGNQFPNSEILSFDSIEDSIAVLFIQDKILWEKAHRQLAAFYLKRGLIDLFIEEMDALISQYPVIIEYYDYVSNVLIQNKDYERAYKYLETGYELKPSAFTSKWLGTINLFNNKLDNAEKYLKRSLTYDSRDPQVWYNLAGVYVRRNEYKLALENVNKAISLKPIYPEAVDLQRRLQSAVNNKN